MVRSSLILIMLCGLLAAGCSTPRKMNGVKELTAHQQFQKAAQSAPQFTREALKMVARLEYELERKK